VADNVQITFSVDASDALGEINQLKTAIAGLNAPLLAMAAVSMDAAQRQQQAIEQGTRAALENARAMQQIDSQSVAAFKSSMQVMVAQKQLSLQQALGYDIEYTAQVTDQERQRLEAVFANDQAALKDRMAALQLMTELDARYAAQASAEYSRAAEAARAAADRITRSYEAAFDRIGGSVTRTFNDMLTGQTAWAKGVTQMIQEVETFFLDEIETMAARWAASGLAGLAGGAVSTAVSGAQAAGGTGLGAGLTALLGIGQPGGLFGSGLLSGSGTAAMTAQTTAVTANTTALAASTTAITTLTTALTGATAAESSSAGASLAGGGAAAAGAAGGGGLFSWVGGLLGFARGGIVPSAAGGWALPNFAGAMPALLHAREMVLPAEISEGLQGMIGGGGGAGGAHFHAHFHGPADAPAISRWFRENLRSNAGAVRDLFRQNALTPRSF
jgi:hypothetical protein